MEDLKVMCDCCKSDLTYTDEELIAQARATCGWIYSNDDPKLADRIAELMQDNERPRKAEDSPPEDEIEVTAEMIEAGAEYFYGAEPFWHRPASYEETVAALKNAYRAMRHKSGS